MPREIDTEKRLSDIAAATIAVARSAGTRAVTIRAVAAQLGGSTTLVTNYLPSRAALILNALDQGRDRWEAERALALADTEAPQRLRMLLHWALSSSADDPVLRTLILEIVANASFEPDMAEALRRESARFQAVLEQTAEESGFAEPRAVAELAYLLVRGAYIAATEDPGRWTDEHLRAVIDGTIEGQVRRHGVQRTT